MSGIAARIQAGEVQFLVAQAVAQALESAWDEGYQWGNADAQYGVNDTVSNPYATKKRGKR